LVLLLKKARRDERGQKPEEVYVIEDRQLENVGPGGRMEERRIIETGGDQKFTNAVM
jgi:hypothetical protein